MLPQEKNQEKCWGLEVTTSHRIWVQGVQFSIQRHMKNLHYWETWRERGEYHPLIHPTPACCCLCLGANDSIKPICFKYWLLVTAQLHLNPYSLYVYIFMILLVFRRLSSENCIISTFLNAIQEVNICQHGLHGAYNVEI